MVISDLQYLESVETASIVGGSGKHKKNKGYGGIKLNINVVNQYNVALFNKGYVYQSNYAHIS
ncbi:hypothetical protein NDA01_14435 [Trichocoleus desertorum AS-A10]|uniref:hypothetical protein n=1 Tax=Trichocoleus desertorum TaxID=1481672 RepID=UPI003297624A